MIRKVQGPKALIAAVIAGAVGAAFYFLIIGIAELPAAVASLGAFWCLALWVWRRVDDNTNGGPTT